MKNYLLKALFKASEIDLLLQGLAMLGSQKAKELKEKILRMTGEYGG